MTCDPLPDHPSAELVIRNPANGAVVQQIAVDSADEVARKAAAARAAQPAWAATPLSERKRCIARFRALVVHERDRLAQVMTRETGKPISMSRNELDGLLGRIDFFLEQAEAALASETVYHAEGLRERIERVPLGLVACISAWNYPWFVGCNVILPALLCGNAVLYKPSEYATLTGLELAGLLHAAALPRALLACLPGAAATGAALLDQDLEAVCFTGSLPTGRKVAQALAGRMIRLQLELGGKDPVYVCEDVCIRTASASLAEGAMYNTGQSCCAVERIYVHAAIHDTFVAQFVERVKSFPCGDPMDERSYIGPLTRAAQREVLEAQIADALAKGARLLTGGKRGTPPGNWFEPTVLTDVDHRMVLMREESFGPIVGIQKVAGDEEAVHLMNDSHYGLTAGVYCTDEERARRLLAQVHAGSVYWNCCDRVSPRLPWSGVGDSGLGLTLSVEGIRNFTRPKAWHLRSA